MANVYNPQNPLWNNGYKQFPFMRIVWFSKCATDNTAKISYK